MDSSTSTIRKYRKDEMWERSKAQFTWAPGFTLRFTFTHLQHDLRFPQQEMGSRRSRILIVPSHACSRCPLATIACAGQPQVSFSMKKEKALLQKEAYGMVEKAWDLNRDRR